MSVSISDTYGDESDDMEFATQSMKRKRDKQGVDSPIQGNSPTSRDGPTKLEKTSAIQDNVHTVIDSTEHIVYIKGRSRNITLIKPDLIRKDINDQFSVVQKIEKAGQSLRVTCNSETQKMRLLKGNIRLADVSVSVSEPRSTVLIRSQNRDIRIKQFKFVAGGVPLDITDEEMKQASEARSAKRMFKRGPEGPEPTLSVLLTYGEGDEVPDKVHIDYLSFKVRPFVAIPIRCFKCQRFGHVTSSCRSQKTACPTCGGGHTFETCPNKDNPKCINCGGTHSAAYKKCVRYTEIKDTLKLVSYERLSYRDALAKVKATTIVQAVRSEQQQVTAQNVQQNNDESGNAVIVQSNDEITIGDENIQTTSSSKPEPVSVNAQTNNQMPSIINTANPIDTENLFGINVYKFVKLFVNLINLIVTTDDKTVLKSAALGLAMDTLDIAETELNAMMNNAK